MAGTIAITPEDRWSAATWLFDWTVEFLADRVADPKLRDGLNEIVAENLGWLGLGDFGPDAEGEIRRLLSAELVSAAGIAFSETMPNRAGAINHLRDLAEAVG
jgi:hypothetical protein